MWTPENQEQKKVMNIQGVKIMFKSWCKNIGFLRLKDVENRLVVAKGEEKGRVMDWEFGVGRCKWLHLEWSSYIAQGTIFSLLGENMMEDHMRKRMYMYVWLGHCAIQQKLAPHCKSTMPWLEKEKGI